MRCIKWEREKAKGVVNILKEGSKMEKLNANAVALSLGLTIVAIYLVCLIFVAILPLQTIVAVTNSLMHGIDVTSIASKRITLISSLIGVVGSFIGAAIIGYVFAYFYNRIV